MLGVTYTLEDFDENTKKSTKKPKKGFYRPKMTLYKTFSTSLFIPFSKVRILFYIKVFEMYWSGVAPDVKGTLALVDW